MHLLCEDLHVPTVGVVALLAHQIMYGDSCRHTSDLPASPHMMLPHSTGQAMPECMCLLQALQALATSEGCNEKERDLQLAAVEVGIFP